jgi:hypothetical protein
MFFAHAIIRNKQEPVDWPNYAYKKMSELGEILKVEGKVIDGEKNTIAELTKIAEVFKSKKVSLLTKLKVFPPIQE